MTVTFDPPTPRNIKIVLTEKEAWTLARCIGRFSVNDIRRVTNLRISTKEAENFMSLYNELNALNLTEPNTQKKEKY